MVSGGIRARDVRSVPMDRVRALACQAGFNLFLFVSLAPLIRALNHSARRNSAFTTRISGTFSSRLHVLKMRP
jgi:hypothetical protein